MRLYLVTSGFVMAVAGLLLTAGSLYYSKDKTLPDYVKRYIQEGIAVAVSALSGGAVLAGVALLEFAWG